MRWRRRLWGCGLVMLCLATAEGRAEPTEAERALARVEQILTIASKMVAEDLSAEGMADYRAGLLSARGLIILTDIWSAGLMGGGGRGVGLYFKRNGHRWSDPIFIRAYHLNLGPQLGISGGRGFLLVFSGEGVNRLIHGQRHLYTRLIDNLAFWEDESFYEGQWGEEEGRYVLWRRGLQLGAVIEYLQVQPDRQLSGYYYGERSLQEVIEGVGRLALAKQLQSLMLIQLRGQWYQYD